jgi:hypothetical protein
MGRRSVGPHVASPMLFNGFLLNPKSSVRGNNLNSNRLGPL